MRRFLDLGIVIIVVGLFGAGTAAMEADGLRSLALRDTDDMLRLVQSQDLIDGQAWGDLTQRRMLPPEGVPMHWTRHMDVLIAPLVAVAGPTAAAIVVPLVLLALLAWALVAWWAGESARTDRFLLLIAILPTALVLNQFLPGRVDHHGLQILLAVVGGLSLLRGRWVVGGAFLGSSLSVGIDALAPIGTLLITLGLAWALAPERWSHALRQVPMAITIAAILGTLVFAPDGRLWSTVCDATSLPMIAALVVASLGTALIGGSSVATPRVRLLTVAGVGVAAAATLATVRPACLAGPLADLPPDLTERWLTNVTEAQSLTALVGDRPLLALSLIALPVVGLAVMANLVRGSDHRWIPMLGLAAGATIGITLQVRAAPLAVALTIPALGPLVSMVRARRWPAGAVVQPLMVVAALLMAIGLPFVLADSAYGARTEDAALHHSDCAGSHRLAGLADEPPGLVLAHLDLGPAILFHTDHSVVAAPYHRNVDGIRASFDLLDAPTDGTDLARAGIDLVVVCPGQAGNGLYTTTGEDSLMTRLLAGESVPGLETVGDGPLLVSRVTAQP